MLSIGRELVENTINAAFKKQAPVIEVNADTVIVSVASIEHPMFDAHYIEIIVFVIEGGMQMKWLEPVAMFKALARFLWDFQLDGQGYASIFS